MKINCNVAQDLMQPYVENILSRDSRELLEKHLDGCEACKAKLDEIRGINLALDGAIEEAGTVEQAEGAEDVATFRNFKKWINLRRAVAMIVACVVVVTAIVGVSFWATEYQTYIPYEDSGVQVNEEGDIYTKKAYQVCHVFDMMLDADGEGYNYVEFIYLTSSFKSRNLDKSGKIEILTNPKADFGLEIDGEPVPTEITAVYYASPKTLKKEKSFSFRRELLISPYLTEEERQEQVAALIADSVLIWEKD